MPTSPTSAATPASPAGVPHEQLANAIRVLAMDAVEAGEIRAPGHADGHGRRRDRAVDASS